MSTELFFWYGLALKMVMTATIVVIASVAVERSGPFIGALIAALPTAAGAAYILLAIEHPPAFIGASAIGSLAAGAAVAIFALSYTVLAQRHGVVLQHRGRDAHLACRRRRLAIGRLDAGERSRAQRARLRVPSRLSARYRDRDGAARKKLKRTALRHPAAGADRRGGGRRS